MKCTDSCTNAKKKKTWLWDPIVCVYDFQLPSFAIVIFIHGMATVTAIIL